MSLQSVSFFSVKLDRLISFLFFQNEDESCHSSFVSASDEMEVNDSLTDPMYVTSRSIVSTTTTSISLFASENDSSDQNDRGQATSGSLMIENVTTTSANVTDTSEDDRSTSIKVYKC